MTANCFYITLWDSHSRLIWANGFGHGYSQEAALGRKAWDFTDDADEREVIRSAFAAAIAHSESAHYEASGCQEPHVRHSCQLFPIPSSIAGPARVCVTSTPISAAPLTPREFDVFTQLASGQELKEVAVSLGVSHSTIQTHVSSLQKKLGMKSLIELVAYASRAMIAQASPEIPYTPPNV